MAKVPGLLKRGNHRKLIDGKRREEEAMMEKEPRGTGERTPRMVWKGLTKNVSKYHGIMDRR